MLLKMRGREDEKKNKKKERKGLQRSNEICNVNPSEGKRKESKQNQVTEKRK